MPQFSSRHSSFNLRLRSCGSSNSSAIFLPRPATLTTTSQLHHFSSCKCKTIRIIAVEVLQQLQRQLLEVLYTYDGFRDSFWRFCTPTTASAIAFGGFVHLRRVQNASRKSIICKFFPKNELWNGMLGESPP